MKIRDDMPLDRAALIGCGVTTGVGAVLNTARSRPGTTVAVIGSGGVGLAAIQGARIAGARRSSRSTSPTHKLATAKELGATDVVDAAEGDPVKAIRELTGGGVDYSFEAIGSRRRPSRRSMPAAGRHGDDHRHDPGRAEVELDGLVVPAREEDPGQQMGSNRFRVDMPRYVDFYLQGRLKLDEMITRRGRWRTSTRRSGR